LRSKELKERAMTGIGRMTSLLLAVVAVAALAGCGGAGSNKAGGAAPRRVVVLTLANGLGSSELDGFAREVSRLSGGTIRISVENGWRAGQVNYEHGLIKDVRRGKADLGVSGSRAWDALGIDSFRALATPLLINSYGLELQVLQSSLIPPMLTGLSRVGLVGLGVLPGPLQRPLGLTRPLLAPSDYAGLRLAAPQSRLAQVTLRALGATPVGLAAGAPISGLGGVAEHITAIQGDRYDEPGSYLTSNVVLWPRPLVVFANDNALARLTPAQRHILIRALTADIIPESNVVQSDERYDTAGLCRRHHLRFVAATPVDLRALGRAVQPVYRELERNAQNRRQIAQIEAMRRSVPAAAAPSCALAGVPAAKLGSVGRLDGVYRFTIDNYAELKAAGASSGELNPGDVGTETFVFDRGHFASTTENPQDCVWAYGTIMVTGAKISLSYSDGGGSPPAAANAPGEQFTLKWSLYRDSLTMRHGPGGAGPTPFVVRPWLRLSTTPSYGYLSKRCPPPANALPH
jgi:TRAP-type C4-dicarboxylate transport system substrate-binding protein